MIVVVEPGVAIKWFVEEPLRPQARSLLVHGHELVAPDILIAGVAELAWKKAVAGEISAEQATPIVRNIGLPAFISTFVESTRLRNRALALALQCGQPVHDCFYAACAEAASAPLVSSDEAFLQALKTERIAIRGVALARIHELQHIPSGWPQPDGMCPVNQKKSGARVSNGMEPRAVPSHRKPL